MQNVPCGQKLHAVESAGTQVPGAVPMNVGKQTLGEALQRVPQDPQFAGSCLGSVQAPSQQTPTFIVCPSAPKPEPNAHEVPLEPGTQLGLTHEVTSHSVPAGHAPGAWQSETPPSPSRHSPPVHAVPLGQVTPQAPQFRPSPSRSLQAPPQHSPEPPSFSGHASPELFRLQVGTDAHVP